MTGVVQTGCGPQSLPESLNERGDMLPSPERPFTLIVAGPDRIDCTGPSANKIRASEVS